MDRWLVLRFEQRAHVLQATESLNLAKSFFYDQTSRFFGGRRSAGGGTPETLYETTFI